MRFLKNTYKKKYLSYNFFIACRQNKANEILQ